MAKKLGSIKSSISIIIVNHNGRHLLEKCLSSLIESAYPNIEIIMVDNASEDDSLDFVSQNFPSVNVLQSKMNLGYAGGCNKGAKFAKGEYIIFMNNDVQVSKDWIEPLVGVCSRHDVTICGGKILFGKTKDRLYSAGGALNLFSVPIDRGFLEMDRGQFDRPEDVAYVSGAALMIEKKTFDELGGFDAKYFAYCEEVDLCLRAWLSGFRVVYVPSSVVYHDFGGSFGRPSPFRRFFGVRNMAFTLIKVLSLKNLILLLPVFLSFRLFEGIVLAMSGKRGYLLSFKSAIASVFSNFRDILSKRKRVQENRRVNDKRILRFFLHIRWMTFIFKKNILRSVF
ncbi:MAG: glycosyltransferase family 2 protein [Candidatus Bathyarchaeota archaeon]|nr:glycosyltransferase family 2 protein [Candidatus Bathyarchaeota archaeon]